MRGFVLPFYIVIAGLDPAIHDERQPALTVSMDAWGKPGHDHLGPAMTKECATVLRRTENR
jgi:hypothetical protein